MKKCKDSIPQSSITDKKVIMHNNSATNLSSTTVKGNTESCQVFVKCSNKNDGKRAWDKRYDCVFCGKLFPKLPRHLEDMHSNEGEVKRMMSLKAHEDDSNDAKKLKAKMRKEIIDSLRRTGNYHHNMKVLKAGRGQLLVKRCPPSEVPYTEYLPCSHCLEFFFRKDLHRHMKTCSCKKNDFKEMHGGRVQSCASMMLPQHADITDALGKIHQRMKIDEVSALLKTDDTIIKYGNALCRKHFNNDDQTYYISNKLRELGRLLFKMRERKLVQVFLDVINPQLFPEVVQCVKELCGWNEETKLIEIPSLGIKLGQLLTKVSYMVKGQAIIESDSMKRAKADDFLYLVSSKWNDEVGRLGRNELEKKKWNKPNLIPLADDLKNFKLHLSETLSTSINKLAQDNSDQPAWRDLCSSILASLILFNRRRQGEASKLEVAHIQELKKGAPNDDVEKSLTPFERKLCEHFKRVEIRGKRGRKVPMIISKKLESAIKLLNKLRCNVGVNPKNKYIFALPSMNSLNYVRGSDAMRKHVKLCSLKCPEAITSTKLRKHIATLSQLVNLEERELEMLAGYLGHDINVHREFYRLPEDTLQVAKCGKLLMMMDKGTISDYKGKSLDEIEMDLQGSVFYSIM